MGEDGYLVEMRGIRKAFGPVVALDGVDFALAPGEVHGLLGGNGAGKTTLMNVLYGLYRPDAGEILIEGRPVEVRSPRDALAHGIGMVHQHFLQIENFTVAQNVVLGRREAGLLGLNLEEAERRLTELAARFGLEVNPRAVIADLPMGARQRVEILKALYRGVRVLILDEPTTHLTPQEVDALFESLEAMVAQGMSVVFITHKLREVMKVCDTITVLRDGRRVLTTPRAQADEESLVRSMVGGEVDVQASLLFRGERGEAGRALEKAPLALRVEGLEVAGSEEEVALHEVTFEVHQGEVFGIAGVAGNGQRELAEALFGVRPVDGGRVWLGEEDITHLPTQARIRRGMAYIPEDRLRDGYLPAATVAHNLVLGLHAEPPFSHRGLLDRRAILENAQAQIADYNIRTQGPEDLAARLSGGNIQRLLLARAFTRPLRVLLAHNPTSGLDIPSTEAFYERLLARREQGMATLLISDDLDELLLLSDRIGVLYRGQLVGVLEREAFDRYAIGRLMSGVDVDG